LKLVLDRKLIVTNAAPVSDVGKYLKPSARGGEIRIVLPLEDRGREMEFILPGRYDVSPREAIRIEALPIVAEIIEI
jgi:DNA polymerase III subunit alpha